MRRRLALVWLAACSASPAAPSSDAPALPAPPPAPAPTPRVALDPGPPAPPPEPRTPSRPLPEPMKEGYFRCVDRQCKAHTETCCELSQTCMPRAADPPLGTCDVRKECDVSSDCLDGQRCCVQGYALGTPYYPRRCEAQCREAEACREGTCPPGQVCWDGTCANPDVEVRCGDTLCSGAQPFCEWDDKRKTGQCVAPGPSTPGVYSCDDDGDCLAGERCWLGASGNSWCCRGASCFDHAASTKFVACKTDRDCRLLDTLTFTCVADDTLLPHLHGYCQPNYPKR